MDNYEKLLEALKEWEVAVNKTIDRQAEVNKTLKALTERHNEFIRSLTKFSNQTQHTDNGFKKYIIK